MTFFNNDFMKKIVSVGSGAYVNAGAGIGKMGSVLGQVLQFGWLKDKLIEFCPLLLFEAPSRLNPGQ